MCAPLGIDPLVSQKWLYLLVLVVLSVWGEEEEVYKHSLFLCLLLLVACVLCVVIQFILHHHRCRCCCYRRHQDEAIWYNTIQYDTIQYDAIKSNVMGLCPKPSVIWHALMILPLSTVRHSSTCSTYESDHYVYFWNLRLKKKLISITTHLFFTFSLSHKKAFTIFWLFLLIFSFFLYLSQYKLNKTGWYSYGCVL